MKRLDRNFFARKPELVAPELLGKLLVRQKNGMFCVGKIVETEAYLGLGDKASHSHRGKTERNTVMFGEAGFSYVYFTYGMHWLLNIITEEVGKPSGVLIRALEPLAENNSPIAILENDNKKARGKVLSGEDLKQLRQKGGGPARLTRWLGINRELNKIDITKSKELFVTDEIKIGNSLFNSEKIESNQIVAATRVGVDYAEEHKDLELRFYIKDNIFISKK